MSGLTKIFLVEFLEFSLCQLFYNNYCFVLLYFETPNAPGVGLEDKGWQDSIIKKGVC